MKQANNILELLKSTQGFFNMTKNEENMEAINKQEIWGASKGMSQIYSLLSYSKKEHGFMNEKLGNKIKRETLYHSTKSWNPTTILFHHPRTSKKLSKSMRQVFLPKLIWPYIASIHQFQPCLQWKPLEYIGKSEENLLVQLAISLAYPKYLILSLRLCKAQGTKYLIKYLKNAEKGK